MKKIFRFVVFTALVFGMVLLGTFILSKVYKQQIKELIIRNVENRFHTEVELKDFQLNFFRGFPNIAIGLDGFLIKGKNNFANDTLVYVQTLQLNLDIKKWLVDKEIHVKSIALDNPYIHILTLNDGTSNLDNFKADTNQRATSAADSTALFVEVEKIAIKNGTIRFEDHFKNRFITLDGLENTAKWEIDKSIFDFESKTVINDFSVDWEGVNYMYKKETAFDVKLTVDNEKNRYEFKENNFRINHFNFGINGFVQLMGDSLDLDIALASKETTFKHLLSLLPGIFVKDLEKYNTNGDITFSGSAKGILNTKKNQFPAYNLNVLVENASFNYEGLPSKVKNINANLSIQNPTGDSKDLKINVPAFTLAMDSNSVKGKFSLSNLSKPEIHAEIKASLALHELEKFYPITNYSISGFLAVDAKIDGKYDPKQKLFPNIDAFLSIEKGFVQTNSFPEPIEKIEFKAEVRNAKGNLENAMATINTFTFEIGGDPFLLSGSIVNFHDYTYDLLIDGKLDLSKLIALYPQGDLKLEGHLDMDFSAKGKASDLENRRFNKVDAEGLIQLTEFKASGGKLPKPITIHDALLYFSPETIKMSSCDGKFGKSDFRLSGQISNYLSFISKTDADIVTATLTLNSDTLDLNDFVQNAANSNIKRSDTTSKLLILPTYLDILFDSDIKYVTYLDMKMKNVDGAIRLKNGVLTLHETGFNSLGAKFSISGDYNTTNPSEPFFDFNLDIAELDINKAYNEVKLIQQLAPAAKDAYGTLSVKYKLKANLDNQMQPKLETMVGGGTLQIHEAKIDGIKIMDEITRQAKKAKLNDPTAKDFRMETEIKGTKLIVKPFVMKMSDIVAEINGVNDLSGKVDFMVKVGIVPIEGIKLPFHITGTYDKPIIKLGKK